MTTIPIEVIIQDAEAPIVPSEDGTNTNITVPDTGTISINIDTSSSASSIILPAILLILAIGSIVAILIYKHHKQKKDKTTRKEKLAVAASSTIAVLAVTVLIDNLVLPATKAATSDTIDGITPAEDKVSIVVTRDGGVAEASIESTATITSTSDFGYKVLLSMAEGVETSNLYLNGDEASEHYIASTEGTVLTDNTWGYALTEDGEYSAMPLLADAVVLAEGDEPVEDEEMSIYYGAKVSSDLPAGTYSGGDIEYSLVSLEPTIGTLTYMQDFAKLSGSSKTSVIRSMTEDQQYYLKDNRDNKTYRIAKLRDGKVWMTQNLDLQKEDLAPGITINNDNTDFPASGFTLPTSQISNNESWGPYDEEVAINTTHVYDIAGDGQTYYYCAEYYFWGACKTYSEEKISPADLGNYYNWYTATASTGSYGTDNGGVATGSICPAGWVMPNGALSSNIATDYSNLLYTYNIMTSPVGDGSYDSDRLSDASASPLYLMRTGRYDGEPDNVGLGSSIWSSMAFNNTEAKYIYLGGTAILPWDNGEKVKGYSVRCLAQ